MRIEMIDLQAEFLAIEKEVMPVITQVLASGNYIQGQAVRDFEADLAKYLHVKHVISCGNGTDALQIALMALGVSVGDEVIIPAFSYIAVAEVVCLLGATPVFVDVDDIYFQFDVEAVKNAITKKTKAIIPVHLFGQTSNFEAILDLVKQNDIKVIEDCAQALGGKYQVDGKEQHLGSLGDFGCTSFFPTKNLACFGDGGAVFTNDDELAKKARMIANHGQKEKYNHHLIGINSRLDTLQASVLQIKLKNLNQISDKKTQLANHYQQQLQKIKEIELPQTHAKSTNSWHQFTIKVKSGLRDQLKTHLKEQGINSMVYYPMPITNQLAYQKHDTKFPIAEKLSGEVLSLPVHQLLTLKDIDYICSQILEFFDAKA